jgi:tRNA-dihydrouridine synthase A
MKHVDRIFELRHIQHPEGPRRIPNPNFSYASTNRIHGLPVVGFTTMLDPIELISRFTPGRLRKRTQVVERAASKLNGLEGGHRRTIQNFVYASKYFLELRKSIGQGPVPKLNELNMLDARFSVAPMMDWTDRHCRVFHRLMTRRARLYTEMLTTGAILHGDRTRLLGFDASEHPVALQLGGSDPRDLASSAKIGEDFGYDEINLNVGCPSDRVKDGRFGACMMAEPQLVAAGVDAMKRAVKIPVTVKCRLGIDDQDPEVALDELARAVVAAGADALIVHARKAWLNGLSPKENRDIPPLDYHRVYRLKAAMPHVLIIINGGIASLAEARQHLGHVDGVMLGRAAYQEPWRLLSADPELFGEAAPCAAMKDVFEAMAPYIESELGKGTRLHSITRHFVGAFHGVPGARAFRRHLAENGVKPGAGVNVLRDAIALVEGRVAAPIAA